MAALWVQVPNAISSQAGVSVIWIFLFQTAQPDCLVSVYKGYLCLLMGLCRCRCVLVCCVFSMNMYLLSVSENSVMERDKSQSLCVFVV